MNDQGRTISYLRLSITDRCNLRCIYCMPEKGIPILPQAEILTYDEIVEISPSVSGASASRGGSPSCGEGSSAWCAAWRRCRRSRTCR